MTDIDLSEYIFLDPETTGLTPSDDDILEVGMYYASPPDVPAPPRYLTFLVHGAKDFDLWDPFVQKMHLENGLLADKSPTLSLSEASEAIEEFAASCGFGPRNRPMMAGKSIHFDRAFIAQKMPRIDTTIFSHRMMDVSSVIRAQRLMGISFSHEQSGTVHRALADAVDAHALLRLCLGAMQDSLSLAHLQKKAHALAVEKGWWRDVAMDLGGRTRLMSVDKVLALLTLIHSEVSEAAEDVRIGSMLTYTAQNGKPKGFPSELADVVIRCMDLASAMGIDLTDEIVRKHDFNTTREERHGGKLA